MEFQRETIWLLSVSILTKSVLEGFVSLDSSMTCYETLDSSMACCETLDSIPSIPRKERERIKADEREGKRKKKANMYFRASSSDTEILSMDIPRTPPLPSRS